MPKCKTVPVSLVIDQIRAYQYAFIEAVMKANEAIKQRDLFREIALKSKCESMKNSDNCPVDVDDPCPAFFGGYCNACQGAVDAKVRYL
ncbi:hypothetical protein [Gordonibacter sp.]|uniref:hypothetical protein n=1 Tax=Gordonibacter sp. TaxID=1968902 RepID=UPI002FC79757